MFVVFCEKLFLYQYIKIIMSYEYKFCRSNDIFLFEKFFVFFDLMLRYSSVVNSKMFFLYRVLLIELKNNN